jgi:hypothetical protein
MKEIPSCTHVKDDGSPCEAIPVKGTPYCYFHRKYYSPTALPGDKNYQAPLLESHQSIQLALTQLYQAFLSKKIDMKEAQFGLQVLRLASKTISAIEKAAKQAKSGGAKDSEDLKVDGFLKMLLEEEPEKGAPAEPDVAAKEERGVWDPYGCMPKAKG